MKSVSAETLDVITNDHYNELGVVVHAEWNLNRYYRTSVDNTPSEDTDGYDIELFPIESITKNNRPTSGICKAVVGQALVASNYHDVVPSARFYTADVDDEYKYWQSPLSSDPSTFVMTNCAPQVVYVAEDDVDGEPVPIQVLANKINFTVENTFATATDYDVQVKYTTNGAWTTVASDIAVPLNGKVELWYNGTNWTTTPDYDNTVMVSAVRLVVNTMDKEAYFNLIELGFRLEADVSSDVVTWSDSNSMGEVDFITPLGNISTNTANISLFNEHRLYTNSNASSPYYNLLDKGVKFTCWVVYNNERIQEFEMFSDEWDEAVDSTNVSLTDGAKYFMETKPRPVLYEKIPVQEAIWRICDIIGFNNYEVTALDESPHAIIDIFWTDGEKTAWEIFAELSRATQTAIYFDSYGTLQVKTREAAWNPADGAVYDFIRDSVPGGQPSNIASLDSQTQYEANKVTVNYKPTGFSEQRDNIVPFEVVWEAEGDVVLRATPLVRPLMKTDMVMYLYHKGGRTWPWKGMCQIEGEWIAYEGKQYIYYDASNVRRSAWVTSHEQQKRLDASTGEFYRHLNNYTGALKITERGLYNTDPLDHLIGLQPRWSWGRQRNYGATVTTSTGVKLNQGSSTVSISTMPRLTPKDYTYLYHGLTTDAGYKYIGVRMKIDKSAHKDKTAGIFFNSDGSLGTGYFLEVMATSRMSGRVRKDRNEIVLYSMLANGSKQISGGEEVRMKDRSKNHKKGAVTVKDKGVRFAVPANKWITFDLILNTSGATHTIEVWADGRYIMTGTFTGSWRHAATGRLGMFARGGTSATFEYIYGIQNVLATNTTIEPYFDRIDNGWVSDQWMKDWTYETRTVRRKIRRKWTKIKQKYNQRFFDEFGPIVHEIREFDVKFKSETPVLQSKLYYSNTSEAVVTEYVGDVSGARFVMANFARGDAIINGDDSKTGATVNQKLFVYGRPVIQKDAQKVEKTDEWALRRRGPIEVEYESNWIQNEAEAERFADWLTTHWTRADTTLEMEVFGNPLIELGDVVHVNYEHIDDDFYVVGVNNSFDAGLTTNLTLRRVG